MALMAISRLALALAMHCECITHHHRAICAAWTAAYGHESS